MDEGLLNDLLECSVCLERLDTSSRVLPCQHTFCLKCLKVIVESRKELRCPECRVLVETKIEELPPNVLLMRILEGMNTRKGAGGSQRAHRSHGYPQIPGQFQQTHDSKPVPPHARAIYDFISKEPGDLSFTKGETILLKKKLDAFWYQGECSGRTGMFPITYVQVVIPLPVAAALCKALYDFRMTAPDEEGCLAFDKGAIITVHRRVDDNWAEGRLDQRVGIFPLAFVELNVSARHLINSTPLNRPVPAIPEQTRAGHSDLARHHAQLAHRYQQMSMSTPATHANYQNVATMSQSHPNFHAHMQPSKALQQNVNQITATRNIIEPTQTKHSIDLIHFANVQNKSGTVLQSVSRNLENSIKVRKKFEYNPSQSAQNHENTYQNVRCDRFPASVANFNTNMSSDSSSSMNTPVGISPSLNTTPNSSDTSTSESVEATPCSPENTAERENTVISTSNIEEEANVENLEPSRNTECSRNVEASPNTSIGVLSLNESSTATNTSLNVSLPSECSQQQPNSTPNASHHNKDDNTEQRLDMPCSSKQRASGPDSLLTFGLGLQAALSPSHCKDGYRAHRDPHYREKRHSLTPSTHLQGNHTPNRHSAEILATSLLDHTPERDRDRERPERERDRRRRRSRSNERTLPATYVALYPYKPQKSDELELKKGGLYTVTERCRDGWFKGVSERSQRSGVFPGNYVAPISGARTRHDKITPVSSAASVVSTASPVPSQPAQSGQSPGATAPQTSAPDPPLAPPRYSPLTGQPMSYPWSSQAQLQHATPKSDKSCKQKQEKPVSSGLTSGGVSLMKRLAAMKKCKSPPPAYSMDNPVFEDTPGPAPAPSTAQTTHAHPHHVRSGSCPSQLLRSLPAAERRRAPPAHAHRQIRTATETSPWPSQSQHRKSQSLDVTTTRKDKHHTQTVKERFRCIVPYPPNSEYELELKVDDIVMVSRKRGDGWYKGTLQRTGRTGLFPASFVQSCPE